MITLDVGHLWSLLLTGSVTVQDGERSVRLARPPAREAWKRGPASIIRRTDVVSLLSSGKTMVLDHANSGGWLEIQFQPPPERDEYETGQLVIVDGTEIARVDNHDHSAQVAVVEYAEDRSVEIVSYDRLR